jgi:SAM-dependent methyltransferase
MLIQPDPVPSNASKYIMTHMPKLAGPFSDCARMAVRYNVSGDIDPADHIFWFLHGHPAIGASAAEHYFSDGRDCAVKLRKLIEEHLAGGSLSILEFASGYGRVTRHLPNVLPEARYTACDIHAAAIRFVSRLGVEAVQSCEVPEEFDLARSFDVVFALSFFSHAAPRIWARWLHRLVQHTAVGGLTIFTTHGERSRSQVAPGSEPVGDFVFLPHSEQPDLPSDQYGTALTPLQFVYAQIAALETSRLIKFEEGYWWGHQDVYVMRRI